MEWLNRLAQQLEAADPTKFWWGFGIVAVIAAIALYFGFTRIARARLIEDTPTSKIRSAAQGYVELIGHSALMDGPPITAPLTGEQCVWWRYKIEEERQSNKKTEWRTIDSESSDALFLMEDETGSCVVDPEDAEVTTEIRDQWYGNSRWPDSKPGNEGGLLDLVVGRRYRYTEWRMLNDAPLYAIGYFETVGRDAENQGIKDEVRDLVRKWKHDPEQMQRFDANADGEIDMDEFQALRQAAHQEVMVSRLKGGESPAVNLMKKPGHRKRPYLLSTLDPERLVGRYRWGGRIGLLVGVVLAAGSAWALQIRLF